MAVREAADTAALVTLCPEIVSVTTFGSVTGIGASDPGGIIDLLAAELLRSRGATPSVLTDKSSHDRRGAESRGPDPLLALSAGAMLALITLLVWAIATYAENITPAWGSRIGSGQSYPHYQQLALIPAVFR